MSNKIKIRELKTTKSCDFIKSFKKQKQSVVNQRTTEAILKNARIQK